MKVEQVCATWARFLPTLQLLPPMVRRSPTPTLGAVWLACVVSRLSWRLIHRHRHTHWYPVTCSIFASMFLVIANTRFCFVYLVFLFVFLTSRVLQSNAHTSASCWKARSHLCFAFPTCIDDFMFCCCSWQLNRCSQYAQGVWGWPSHFIYHLTSHI